DASLAAAPCAPRATATTTILTRKPRVDHLEIVRHPRIPGRHLARRARERDGACGVPLGLDEGARQLEVERGADSLVERSGGGHRPRALERAPRLVGTAERLLALAEDSQVLHDVRMVAAVQLLLERQAGERLLERLLIAAEPVQRVGEIAAAVADLDVVGADGRQERGETLARERDRVGGASHRDDRLSLAAQPAAVRGVLRAV